MNLFLLALFFITISALVLVSWQHRKLLREIDEFADSMRKPEKKFLVFGKNLNNLSSALESLRESTEIRLSQTVSENGRMANILNQMTDGVLIVDINGRIQFANPAAGRMFGIKDVLGHSVVQVVRHHQLIETWQRGQQSKTIQSDTVELPVTRQFFQFVVIPDEYAGGALLLVQDLTRLRRLESVRQDFISNVSHELRTPLASLKALTETLLTGALDDPTVARRFLERIEAEVDALTQMASELLDLTRIESGQTALNLEPVSPNHILLSASDRMKMQAERARLDLSVQLAEDLPLVQADLARIEQVLVNLIHNAIKFTQPGGKVILGSSKFGQQNARRENAKDFVQVWVQDTGSGISVDDLSRIFERFYRVDRARTKGSGTGLGLSIAKHIVEEHGGKIWAESEEGKGSAFYFTIPVQM